MGSSLPLTKPYTHQLISSCWDTQFISWRLHHGKPHYRMPWGQEEPVTICPSPLPHVGTQTHQSSWPRTILGSSDSSCVLKKGRDPAGKEAGRVGGKGRWCGTLPSRWLKAQPHSACWLGLVLQEVLLVLQVLLVPISCAVVWGRVLSVTALQDVTCHCCKAADVQAGCAAACSSTLPSSWQHSTASFWGSSLDIVLRRSCSPGLPWGMECWKPLSCCKRMPRNPSGISVHGGLKAAMVNAHLRVYEQCWRERGWHGGEVGKGVSREVKICGWKTQKLERNCLENPPHQFLHFVKGQLVCLLGEF